MKTNHTIKAAVISALTMLALGAQNQALALGLGNIDVKSHLGQPLRASIKIEGANDLKNESCFRLLNDPNADNQLAQANFKLSKIDNGVAILTVTTNDVINDPIVNLSVMADCDANMQRDYVLLLDPLLSAEDTSFEELAPTISDEQTSTKKQNKKVKHENQAPKYSQMIIVGEPLKDAGEAPKEKSSAKKHNKNKNTNKDIVLNANKPTETVNPNNNIEKTNKPHLSISGGDTSNFDLNSAKLQLDKQLHFTPETAAQALSPEIDTDMQDEATIMAHRLAHLEKQISALSLSNNNLKAENALSKQQLAESNSWNNKFAWLGYILGGALVFGSVTIADKWRRRRQDEELEIAQMEWERDAATSHNSTDEVAEIPLMGVDIEEANDEFFEAESKQTATKEIDKIEDIFKDTGSAKEQALTFSVEEFNADQNVLDHADVFLSHGRVSLAIQLLQNHLLDFPKQSVTIWMFLLDLLAKENLQAVYEQTALECKEYFNVKIADFSKLEDDSGASLESYPRISAGLQQAWGSSAALVYLDDLIYNSRLEVRVGFHKSVIEELLMLKNVAQEELKTAEVIQLDEKKLEMMELKEAQLAVKKEERLKKMEELALKEAEKKLANANETSFERFEFNLIEYN